MRGRKRVLPIVTAILAARHYSTPHDLFGTPQGSPIADGIIGAAIQWADQIMQRIDRNWPNQGHQDIE
jgi:hypothetical protein